MIDKAALNLNSHCYCWPVERAAVIDKILEQDAAADMTEMLSTREHYFANTTIFLAPDILAQMKAQIRAIEAVLKLPKYIQRVSDRNGLSDNAHGEYKTSGVFMGYDFHITDNGPRLIEINSNAGGAFIVNMIEQAALGKRNSVATKIAKMFVTEWQQSGRTVPLKTIAIVDTNPVQQYHFPDMCLAKALLKNHGFHVVIADPRELRITDERLVYRDDVPIDLVYNRLTDFDLSDEDNAVIKHAYNDNLAVITPAPHHHALYADKRNLILLSDPACLTQYGATPSEIKTLGAIPRTVAVTDDTAAQLWDNRRKLFFKPQAGFGSRGAFRGAKLTKKVWGEILDGDYIAQALITPPVRAVTVNGAPTTLKFDVRIYSYDGSPLLFAARIYQGQTTNLRTAGGGLAAVIPIKDMTDCKG